MCAEGHRPLCQDTGIVVAFVRVGMDVRWEGATMSVTEMVNEGVRRAYNHPDNPLRASVLVDPAGRRANTKDNTPAVVHFDLVPGDTVDVRIAAKGGGSKTSRNSHAQSERFDRGLGVEDGAHDGCRLVPARHARHRRGRHG
jgi:fumarate hydratase class I